MSEPIIQADASLVRNSDFREGFSFWNRGPTNPNWVGRIKESYQGEDIYCLTAGNLASVSQIVDAPKDLRANARYILSFLCESWHDKDGRLEVCIEGSSEPAQVITLPAGSRLNSQVDKERHADQQPMLFNPEQYEVELTLPLKQNDKVRVSVFSPASRDDEYGKVIRITRIEIRLHLEPLVLQQLTLDDQTLPPARTLYLCLGAVGSLNHRLGFVPAPDNAWRDTAASLNIENNPQDGSIVATPMWGLDHPLDGFWEFYCPLIDGDGPFEFWFYLLNKYTADAYRINASLGHHRLVFREVLEAAFYPVVEYAQSVRLGVQVASYYTGQALNGRTVNWGVKGQRQAISVLTDDEGWAYFDYAPSRAGDFVIEAWVASLYYASGVFTQGFEVRVLATDPWKEVKAVIDGKETPWDEKTGYPNRGTQYPVTLKLPANSPLLGTELWLLWDGDTPAELGVTVNPPLEEPVPVSVVELSWRLTCEDRIDGRFYLQLGCSKLLRPSSKKLMSLARNNVEIGEVREANKFPVVDENESVLLMVQVTHVVTSGPGDPVVNALVDWVGPNGTVSTVTGDGGWASVLDTPRTAGGYTITAKVRAHVDMQPVERAFAVTALATSPWKDTVLFHLDGEPVDLVVVGIACRRGKPHTFRVTPTAGSPVKDKPMTLTWRDGEPGLGLTIGAPTATPAGGWEWRLSSGISASRSGLFELKLTSDVVSGARELSGRLLSENLADEGRLVLDQVSATVGDQTLFPCLGAVHRYKLLPNALSPLIGLDLKLAWSGTPAGELGATVTPALPLPQPINAGGAAWALDFTASQKTGQFSLALELPQLKLTSTANVMQLAHNKVRIETLREAAVDPVVGQDRAWQWARVISSFTRQPVVQVPVKWTAVGASADVDTDANGWSGYGLAPTTARRHDVEALVFSPYDDYQDKRAMTVNALASDPWRGLVVQFDGKSSQVWGAKTYFPRRKGEHSIELSVPEGSPLLNQKVMLGLTGTGPTVLGLTFSPALGVPQLLTRDGLSYTLKGGDLKDGSFALRLAASRLSNLSPANALSLGSGGQILKIIVSHRVHQTLDWGQALYEQVTVVSAISGKPMAGWTVTWRSPDLGVVTTVTDFYGVARIHFMPKNPGAAELTATVGDELHSDTLSLTFTMNEPRKISEIYEGDNDKWPVEWESQVHALAKVVSSRTGLPLEGVEVMWEYAGRAMSPSLTDADGIARLTFVLTAEGHGVLSAAVKGGVGGWDTAQLVYGGVVPVIESLTAAGPTEIVLGGETRAKARVVSRADGQPLVGVTVFWNISGLSLPVTITDQNGNSWITFTPVELGENRLTATAGLGSNQSLTYHVFDPANTPMIERITNRSLQNVVGSEAHIEVRIVSQETGLPLAGELVSWGYLGMGLTPARTNADGVAEVRFIFPKVSNDPFWVLVRGAVKYVAIRVSAPS
ncbi:hypothetical protein [Pseudomonas sp. 6D_7.1_Bac1]|uniref:hypothetical protein n=1 Tax=Pseudomonas sp. 6D_7.1_Bac1 TaxID=2971615 RepID=UPI0021C68860|nr:hypothetical protein [Pseudomonas sp. 6D_7.1_Bac1]MCU1751294.1 hypothetical protein [Pseudomonas sp. 6D_7.1_Bac1]